MGDIFPSALEFDHDFKIYPRQGAEDFVRHVSLLMTRFRRGLHEILKYAISTSYYRLIHIFSIFFKFHTNGDFIMVTAWSFRL